MTASLAVRRLRRASWVAGAPVRWLLVAFIAVYQRTLSGLMGGGCRFYPSCSSYATSAIRNRGAIRGMALAVWRILRCSPLTPGGVEHPPSPLWYDGSVQTPHRGASREAAPAAA